MLQLFYFLCLQKKPEFHSVRDLIANTFSSLGEHVQHPANCKELLSLIGFIEYKIALEQFEHDDAMYEERKEQERQKILSAAIREWDTNNARRIEETLWDWNPIWHILSANDKFLGRLPSLPWQHDS